MTQEMEGRRIRVAGGHRDVGFRPWVHRIARLSGVEVRVQEDETEAVIDAFGRDPALLYFLRRISSPGVRVPDRRICWESIPYETPAESSASPLAAIHSRVPDLAPCEACLADAQDPASLRHGDLFVSCPSCGPHFSVGLAPSGPAASGETVTLLDAGGAVLGAGHSAIVAAASALREGLVVAIKGNGGFRLLCLASDARAVAALRERKRTPERPFAVLIGSLGESELLANVSAEERELLASPERPIVLCRRKARVPVADSVAARTNLLGLVLPDSALLGQLMAEIGAPLVTTSGNHSGDPVVCRNEDALVRLRWIADNFLLHNQPVWTACEDSVVRVIAGKPALLRRARGWVPRSIPVVRRFVEPVLALGAGVETAAAFGCDREVVLGPPRRNTETVEAVEALEEQADRLARIVGVEPAIVVHDLDPTDASSRWARQCSRKPTLAVQRDHAHVVAAMAEHGQRGPVLGLVFDDGGRGTDGAIWGGEFLFADDEDFRRVATFRPLPLAGGAQLTKEPWRVALAMLDDAFGCALPDEIVRRLLPGVGTAEKDAARASIRNAAGVLRSHSVARRCDAFAAMGLRRSLASFDGQLAAEWASIVAPFEHRSYPWSLDESGTVRLIDLRPAVRVAAQELLRDRPAEIVAAKFQNTLAAVAVSVTTLLLSEVGRVPVVLTGRCFENAPLAETILAELSDETEVLLPSLIPPGDGGIALGQAIVADALLRRDRERQQSVDRETPPDAAHEGAHQL